MQTLRTIDDLNEAIDNLVNNFFETKGAELVPPDMLGLDRRSAQMVWVCEDFIAVKLSNDRTMQYYGGFEYVDKEHRYEYGNFVIYSAQDGRVEEHIDTYMMNNIGEGLVNE